ncbi:hypothetical protein AAT19DRAFT_16551 [Rhodotorula toruloides]|uniref:Transmembrane protein n=1 Tax=Rhodotorula toruloides TaxID=5286 RepID=A0A2T0A3P4_RHOTO|nr:hypothetical protein AAT19DRAFT_16551 [Rhodotorula toruloides]
MTLCSTGLTTFLLARSHRQEVVASRSPRLSLRMALFLSRRAVVTVIVRRFAFDQRRPSTPLAYPFLFPSSRPAYLLKRTLVFLLILCNVSLIVALLHGAVPRLTLVFTTPSSGPWLPSLSARRSLPLLCTVLVYSLVLSSPAPEIPYTFTGFASLPRGG